MLFHTQSSWIGIFIPPVCLYVPVWYCWSQFVLGCSNYNFISVSYSLISTIVLQAASIEVTTVRVVPETNYNCYIQLKYRQGVIS